MSKMLILLGIVLGILFIKYQYPEMYDTGRNVAVDAYDGFTSKPDTDDLINMSDADAEGFINTSGEVLGFPYNNFNCTEDIDCWMYDDALCNITSGVCYYG